MLEKLLLESRFAESFEEVISTEALFALVVASQHLQEPFEGLMSDHQTT